MRSWAVVDGRLVLDGRDEVSAEEVFRSIVEGEHVWSDVEPGQTGAAAELTFSRYPAHPIALLQQVQGLPRLILDASLSDGIRASLEPSALETGHFLYDGVWYPLDPVATADLHSLCAQAGVRLGVPIRSLPALLTLKRAAANDAASVEDRLPLDAEMALALAPEVLHGPRGIVAQLYPYQLDGWRWLRFLLQQKVGALLADEMGLGKTLQVISAITDGTPEGKLSPSLIIAPGSLLENWKREISRFSPSLSVLKHHGPTRTGRPAELRRYDVVITSYDNIHRDSALFTMIEWRVVVLDEAQNIKNPDALRTRAVKALPRQSGLAVTGTPFENRLLDLWSILDFTNHNYLGERADFTKTFKDGIQAAIELEPLISPFTLRRRIRDVATDLPDRIDIPQALELEEAEATAYEAMRLSIVEQYGKAATIVALTKLRMFCAHPALIEVSERGDTASFSKTQRLLEILAELFDRGEKALIFTSFTEMSDIIVSEIHTQFGVFAKSLDGRLAIDGRQPLIDEFSDQRGPAALVLNPRAGGTGLNITAANHVIHYNLEWNPAVEDQASARAYRRGQDLPVTVHRLFFAGTVEEIVNQRLDRKRQMSEGAVVGVSGEQEDLADVMAALERSPLAGKRKL